MSKALQLMPNTLPIPVGSLEAYLQRVNTIPLLTAEEEYRLATQYQQEGDLMAAQQLILAHLRYVARIARMFNGYGLPLADLIQEGTIGLMKAVKRFDPNKGVRLVSFAVHWIKSEMHEFIIRNWRIVKVATTKAQRKLFFNLRQSKQRLGWFSQEEVEAVAKDLGVTPADVMEMETRLNARDDSFHPFPEDDNAISYHAPQHYLTASAESEPAYVIHRDTAEADTQEELQAALATLDERSLDIVSQRWLKEQKVPFKALADKYDISIERVRQLENAAFKKIRHLLTSQENA